MPHAQDQNGDRLVPDLADDPPITYPIFPELAQLRTMQGLAQFARIGEVRHPLAQEAGYPLLDRPVLLRQVLDSTGIELNPPSRRSTSSRGIVGNRSASRCAAR